MDAIRTMLLRDDSVQPTRVVMVSYSIGKRRQAFRCVAAEQQLRPQPCQSRWNSYADNRAPGLICIDSRDVQPRDIVGELQHGRRFPPRIARQRDQQPAQP